MKSCMPRVFWRGGGFWLVFCLISFQVLIDCSSLLTNWIPEIIGHKVDITPTEACNIKLDKELTRSWFGNGNILNFEMEIWSTVDLLFVVCMRNVYTA